MTITEQIKAEIERLKTVQLKRIQEGDLVDAEPYDKNEAYNELLSFLDTLESEKPIDQDEVLNEEIKKEMAKLPFVIRGKDLIAYARHFAKWGAEHLADARKMSQNDLADAAKFSSRLDGFFYGKGYEQAEKDLGWISVKDRLPDTMDYVFTCIKMCGIPQCVGFHYYKDGIWWEGYEEHAVGAIEYWMQIPKFKEDEK